VSDSEEEPPCPPGLRSLSAPLEALVDFLHMDRDLVTAAAARSPVLGEVPREDLERWLRSLADGERTALLVRFIDGTDPHVRYETLRRFQESRERTSGADFAPRTVAALLAEAERLREERERIEAERAAQERARRERTATEVRNRELDALERREAAAWAEVDALIATKQPRRYNEAVRLLHDLRDLGARRGGAAAIEARILRRSRETAGVCSPEAGHC
jgi:hypothetical protein